MPRNGSWFSRHWYRLMGITIGIVLFAHANGPEGTVWETVCGFFLWWTPLIVAIIRSIDHSLDRIHTPKHVP